MRERLVSGGVRIWKLLKSRKAKITLGSMLEILMGVLFAIAIVPVIVTQHATVNAAAWTFTGATGAAAIWGLIPLVVIAGYVVMRILQR